MALNERLRVRFMRNLLQGAVVFSWHILVKTSARAMQVTRRIAKCVRRKMSDTESLCCEGLKPSARVSYSPLICRINYGQEHLQSMLRSSKRLVHLQKLQNKPVCPCKWLGWKWWQFRSSTPELSGIILRAIPHWRCITPNNSKDCSHLQSSVAAESVPILLNCIELQVYRWDNHGELIWWQMLV